ncbi:MAG: winged helix-turn-helix domain-containing protein, partial [Chloroflexota bacterium]|nr:winged helix-turn-helix domain-containing protein [Chloroflexota bacterium]
DLQSKNGVYQNLTRIQPGKRMILNDQDQIQIGSVSTFEFHDPEATIHQAEKRMLVLGLWLDEPNREVYVFNRRLTPILSNQQFTLLSALVAKTGDVMTNDEIAAVLWPEAAGGVESAAIDNAICRLRDRLKELDETHEYIETARGVGRRFVQRKLNA